MRATFKTTLNVGLFSVGVKAFSRQTTAPRTVTCCKECQNRAKQELKCSACSSADIGRAIETPNGLLPLPERLTAKKENTQRVVFSALSSASFDAYRKQNTYLLLPEKGNERSYSLLLAGLKRTKKTLFGSSVVYGAERDFALRVADDPCLFELIPLVWCDEVKDTKPVSELAPAKSRLSKQENQAIDKLLGEVCATWEPRSDPQRALIDAYAREKMPKRRKEDNVDALVDAINKSLKKKENAK